MNILFRLACLENQRCQEAEHVGEQCSLHLILSLPQDLRRVNCVHSRSFDRCSGRSEEDTSSYWIGTVTSPVHTTKRVSTYCTDYTHFRNDTHQISAPQQPCFTSTHLLAVHLHLRNGKLFQMPLVSLSWFNELADSADVRALMNTLEVPCSGCASYTILTTLRSIMSRSLYQVVSSSIELFLDCLVWLCLVVIWLVPSSWFC